MSARWRLLGLLMLAACSRGSHPAKGQEANGRGFKDPLAEVSPRWRDAQLIKVTVATKGAYCGYHEGNETERLARLCNGRRRCDVVVEDGLVPEKRSGKSEKLCLPDYKVAWTCGKSAVNHQLDSVTAEQGAARLRLGCGDVAVPRASIATPEPKTEATAGDPADVRGRVVDEGGVGIARLNVSLGDRTTLTGPEGEFVFDRAPKTYDIKITGRESFRATVYLGLSRRDPVLAFTADSTRDRSTRHHASVAGVVFPGNEKSLGQDRNSGVWFLSPQALAKGTGFYAVTEDGSRRYSPVDIGWNAAGEVRGVLVALLDSPSGEPWSSAHMATTALLLKDGDAAGVDLRPVPVPTGHIAGRIRPPTGQPAEQETERLRFSYVIPRWHGDIDLGECTTSDGAYDCLLPDLSSLGGEYCLRLGNFLGANGAIRCGGQLGMKDFSLAHAPPPVLKVDEAGRTFSWTRGPGVVQLAIGLTYSRMVHVYTSDSSYPFSALADLEIPLHENDLRVAGMGAKRKGTGIGNVAVSALTPYVNMDELAAGRGALAMGTSWQMHTTKIDDVVLGVDLKWKRQRPTPGFDPLAPDGLPACAHQTLTQAVGAVPLARFGETVSVRGILTFDGTWACTLKGCENHCCNNCSTSLVVTATDGKGPALRLQRAEDHHPLGLTTLECKRPEPPSIEVVATGRLSLDDHARPPYRRKLFLLDEVALCAVKAAP